MGLFSRSSESASDATPASGLAEPLTSVTRASPPIGAPEPPAQASERQAYFQRMKVSIHQQLVDKLDLQSLRSLPADTVRQEVRVLIRELCASEKGLLSAAEQDRLMDDVMDETFGLGPLEPLLKDHEITDVLVNRCDRVYVERRGKLTLTDVRFRDNDHLRQIIDRIVARIGRRIDEISPMVDARLADGSRVNAIIPPLALDGPALSIRRFGAAPLTEQDLLKLGSVRPEMLLFLAAAVRARCNILISGGTGSGKTTLLNCLSRHVPPEERVVTIEDAAELQLQQPHVVRLETRPPNIEGRGEVVQRDLVKNSLRMRPDRIIVGEVRGAEALDMLQAMNTGHEGSMTTIHANTTRDALSRLEVMVAMAGFDIPVRAIRQQVASALNIVVQAQRLIGGRRRLISISEITGMEGDAIQMHDIFTFVQEGVDAEGHATGDFIATGIRPRCVERIQHFGIQIPGDLFTRRVLE